MGYLDKSKRTVTAHFTKRGRELLANAIAGDTSGDYIITQYQRHLIECLRTAHF